MMLLEFAENDFERHGVYRCLTGKQPIAVSNETFLPCYLHLYINSIASLTAPFFQRIIIFALRKRNIDFCSVVPK